VDLNACLPANCRLLPRTALHIEAAGTKLSRFEARPEWLWPYEALQNGAWWCRGERRPAASRNVRLPVPGEKSDASRMLAFGVPSIWSLSNARVAMKSRHCDTLCRQGNQPPKRGSFRHAGSPRLQRPALTAAQVKQGDADGLPHDQAKNHAQA